MQRRSGYHSLKFILVTVVAFCCCCCDNNDNQYGKYDNHNSLNKRSFSLINEILALFGDNEARLKTEYYTVFYWERLWEKDENSNSIKFVGIAKGLLACRNLAKRYAGDIKEDWCWRSYCCKSTDGGVYRYEDYFEETDFGNCWWLR
ncbi:hypothetical protein Fsol_00680 [Candidatus Fokinia solitaria]|uniref:Uncharacterized protein n=1 Tax=Candidatus Fokinia solitaria TaxID=1802984 RepID=A0A2U8BTG4_9RICK|nr:hypothetical protein [Candidatus Fokinia solitaria]AWD33457.1 hypothetical protein Fsol_00680 [Candidatus Fokinia solitaria]